MKKRIIKTISNEQASAKVLKWRETTRIDDLAEMLGMTKKTLYVRMRSGIWKISDRALIEKI